MCIVSAKVDDLQVLVAQLNEKMGEGFSSPPTPPSATPLFDRSMVTGRGHKDVLVDSEQPDLGDRSERVLSPEIQIQRLTAQLTAAYNRIAVLEEQLLAQRAH
nr:hypothetical protein [Petrachloros mirabilis]